MLDVIDVVQVAVQFVFFGHFQLVRCNEMKSRIEMAHSHQQRVYRASVLQVAHQINVQVFKRALRFINGIQVEHGLRRMLVGTVARIDNRNRSYLAGIACRPFQVVPHHDDVGIIAHHHDGVFQRFPLRRAGDFRVGKPNNFGTQPVGCRFKAQARAGRRLEEKRGYYFFVQQMPVRFFLEFSCHFQ